MPRGWRGGCFWEAGAGGPASPLAVIGFSFPSPAHKGPIEAVGKLLRASSSSRRSSQLLKSHSSPAQARGSGAGIRRAKGKETAGAGSDGGGSRSLSCLGTAVGTPRTFPRGFSRIFSAQHPSRGQCSRGLPGELPAVTLLPGRSCPFPRGGDKSAILRGWQSRGRCHQRPGSRTVPNPAALLSPAALGDPPCSATSRTHGPGAVPASRWGRDATGRGGGRRCLKVG